jgi:aryl-alcohol dehydrogenase-like predicted oxidoreductase
MLTRPFGETGLRVSALGFGAGQIGEGDVSEDDAGRLLNAALDLGITLFDTARSYGRAEERIGRHLAHRRGEFVLSTKGGYGVEGVPDWTGESLRRGIDDALGRMRTDRIDVFHLHSCDEETLGREEIVRALEDAKRAGKVVVAAYSGENEALGAAVSAPVFGSIQCSVNLADQRSLGEAVARAASRGLGVIAKRPLANAPWRFPERPRGLYAEVYWERLSSLRAESPNLDWPDVAARFSAYAPGVSSIIVGTKSLANLKANVEAVERGPLPPDAFEGLRAWFGRSDRGWRGEV